MASFISTRPAPSICPRCQRICLAAVCEGVRTRVDVTVIPRQWFGIAILQDVRLFWLDPIGLAYIDKWRIRSAGYNRYPVLPQHRCDLYWPHEAIVQVTPRISDQIPY